MTMDLAERVQHEISRLPELLVLEVLDFIAYLEYHHGLAERNVPVDERGAGTRAGQAISSFRGSGKGSGTARLLAER